MRHLFELAFQVQPSHVMGILTFVDVSPRRRDCVGGGELSSSAPRASTSAVPRYLYRCPRGIDVHDYMT
jgi:hypothetical protein